MFQILAVKVVGENCIFSSFHCRKRGEDECLERWRRGFSRKTEKRNVYKYGGEECLSKGTTGGSRKGEE